MDTITVAAIREMIASGRIVEAKTLITMHEHTLNAEELLACSQEIEQRFSQAEGVVAQAEAMERAGNSQKAKELYESVLLFASDFPGIRSHIKRMDEAVLLTRAVKRLSQRARQPYLSKQPPKRKRSLPLLVAGLALVLAGGVLMLTMDPKPPESPQNNAAITGAAPTPQLAGTAEPARPQQAEPSPQPPARQEPVATPATVSTPPPTSISSAATSTEHVPPSEPPVATLQEKQARANQPPAEPAASQPALRPTEAVPQQDLFYTVRSGDSLSLIAVRQLCHEAAWRRIYQLNREKIADPEKLHPGMVLRLSGNDNRCHPRTE